MGVCESACSVKLLVLKLPFQKRKILQWISSLESRRITDTFQTPRDVRSVFKYEEVKLEINKRTIKLTASRVET